ncbi:MAG: hypothetical protein ACHQF4_08865 [Sphingobacteriales bacterium]
MKTRLLLAIFILFGVEAKSQAIDKTMYDNSYYFLTSVALQQCDGNGSLLPGPININIPPGIKFKITKIKDDGNYVIQILKATKPNSVVHNVKAFNAKFVISSSTKTPGEQQNQVQQKSGNGDNSPIGNTGTDDGGGDGEDYVFILLPSGTFNSSCDTIVKRHSFALGVLTVPIKIRPGEKLSNGTYRDFSFESDISIGLSFGYKYSPNKHSSYNFLTGVDLTSVPVTPETTNNAVSAATNLSAITWHLGVLFQVNNFQLGAFTGIDYLAGNTGRQWMYRNDMWLGIGIGYSIFSSKKTTDTQ